MSKQQQGRRAPGFLHSRIISIISIAMVLFLVGVVAMLGLVGTGLKDYVRESFNFTVLLTPEATDAEIAAMKGAISGESFAREVEFYSKEQAMAELTQELGESPEEFLGWNPLSPTFEVYVKADYITTQDSIRLVEQKLNSYPLTQSVSFRKDLVEELNSNIRTITLVMIAVAVLLLLISIVLINNTIRLLIYSKRFLIYTMRLVGATPSFIRWPFIRSNVWSGIISSLVALALLGWAWVHVMTSYPIMRTVFTPTNAAIVAGIVLILGILISWFSASAAVTRYLRMDADKLYKA